ncbi:hypothetical protein ASG52_24430 [Methylobacterium sp. Leaf456]|uniref:hypothetical protein n=1 Tax=Methylobacterium sp. Leaf456 TaxID=1736382 RepID=UPI0006F7032E|nr:hypothetical protein [Methylobacterium sp. Leaf456]KQT56145.1 hypothetical protein ASG52_24430 [Methylobacterium sp. Leaf456]
MATLDVVFLAPGRLGWIDETRRRSIPFAPGEPVPRIGECVVLAFEADACRWTVEDVAHVFGKAGHEIAVRLTWTADEARKPVSAGLQADALPPHSNGTVRIGPRPVGR